MSYRRSLATSLNLFNRQRHVPYSLHLNLSCRRSTIYRSVPPSSSKGFSISCLRRCRAGLIMVAICEHWPQGFRCDAPKTVLGFCGTLAEGESSLLLVTVCTLRDSNSQEVLPSGRAELRHMIQRAVGGYASDNFR